MRCCYKYIRGLLMAGHARTNCFLLFTYNQSLPQFGTMASGRVEREHDYMGWASEVRLPPHPSCSSLPFPEKTNKPSLHPSLSLPTALSPSLPLSSKLLEGIVYSRGLHLSLSLSTSPRPLSPPPSLKHHLPQTPLYDSLSHAWS